MRKSRNPKIREIRKSGNPEIRFFDGKIDPQILRILSLFCDIFFSNICSWIFIIFYRFSPPGKALDPRGSKKNQKKIPQKMTFFMIFVKIFKIPS